MAFFTAEKGGGLEKNAEIDLMARRNKAFTRKGASRYNRFVRRRPSDLKNGRGTAAPRLLGKGSCGRKNSEKYRFLKESMK